MTRYHINAKGEAARCRAMKEDNCPFGELGHYDHPADARREFENFMAALPQETPWLRQDWAFKEPLIQDEIVSTLARFTPEGAHLDPVIFTVLDQVQSYDYWRAARNPGAPIAAARIRYRELEGQPIFRATIVLNREIMDYISEEEVREVIDHESAHVVANMRLTLAQSDGEFHSAGHNEQWADTMVEIGKARSAPEVWTPRATRKFSDEFVKEQTYRKPRRLPFIKAQCNNGHNDVFMKIPGMIELERWEVEVENPQGGKEVVTVRRIPEVFTLPTKCVHPQCRGRDVGMTGRFDGPE